MPVVVDRGGVCAVGVESAAPGVAPEDGVVEVRVVVVQIHPAAVAVAAVAVMIVVVAAC